MSGAGSWLYQLLLLLVATFAFLVLFQYGAADFGRHAGEELAWLKGAFSKGGADSSGAN